MNIQSYHKVGTASLFSNAMAILGRAYPPGRRKDIVFNLFAAITPSGFVAGGALATLITKRLWWPWSYWLMGIACFMLAGIGAAVIPRMHVLKRPNWRCTLERADALGTTAGVSGLILVNFALNQAPLGGWSRPYVYVLPIIGFGFLFTFALVERSASYPLLPTNHFTGGAAWILGCVAAG